MLGSAERGVDRDGFVAKASEVYNVHEMSAASRWAQEKGSSRSLWFEEWWMDPDGDGNAPSILQWHSQVEVWVNFELSDGDMVQGWHTSDNKWEWRKPNFEAKVHGDGIFGDDVWITIGNKPRGPF